jgi:uncharacterized membrane protein
MAYPARDPFRLDYEPRLTVSDGGRTIATVNYALYIAAFFTGVTALIGVVLAYARRGNASPLVRSHLDWQIRIFWHCVQAGIAIFVLHWLVIGLGTITFGVGLVFLVIPWAIGVWWLVWTIWAIARGLQRLGQHRGMR